MEEREEENDIIIMSIIKETTLKIAYMFIIFKE